MNFRFINIAVLFLSIFFLAGCNGGDSLLTIVTEEGNSEIYIEVARTDKEKRIGLMGWENLLDGTGMLFVYDVNQRPVMWMKNMLIPLDIVFIGEDFKINHIERDAQPCIGVDTNECMRYKSSYPSNFVLELPAGFTVQHGIDQGDKIILPLGL